MRAAFIDANASLAAVMRKLHRADDLPMDIHETPDIKPDDLPGVLQGVQIMINDHTHCPLAVIKNCPDLKHIVFLGTGARSYMNPEELDAECGVKVHIIKGYGDTAVAEMAFALMWGAARGLGNMHHAIMGGGWPRTDGMQLTGKTIGLIGYGGIAAEMARLCQGIGMRVLAWNRSPKTAPGVHFVELETLLAESHVVSLHLLLNDETRGFLSRAHIARMRQGALLINSARGAVLDEDALVDALASGHLGGAGLDVFVTEPLPAGHALTKLSNVTLSTHSAFRTPEATDNLLEASLEHCRRILRQGY